MARTNMADVAKAAGVSVSTVSRALSNNPQIPAATRQRIQAVADQLRYRPDPLISALVRRRTGQTPRSATTIVYLDSHPRKNNLARHPFRKNLFEGAKQRAESLGYTLDYVWSGDPKLDRDALNRVLLNRGIRGVFIGPLTQGGSRFSLNWDRLCPVTSGYSMINPRLHLAAPDQFLNGLKIFRTLWKLGYRRPGLLMSHNVAQRSFGKWQAAALFFAHQRGIDVPTAILPAITEPTVRAWFEETRPDVIVSVHLQPLAWLTRWGFSVPEDVGYATLSWRQQKKYIAGIDENPQAIGAATIDLCVGLLQRNETGLPVTPKSVLIEGIWKDGDTLRAVSPERE